MILLLIYITNSGTNRNLVAILNFLKIKWLKDQVFLTFSIIALIMVGASFTTYVSVSKLKESELRENFRALQKNVMDVKVSSHEFILKDRNNANFFATDKSEHVEHYERALDNYRNLSTTIKGQLLDIGFSETQELDMLGEKIREYAGIFEKIKSGIKQRGIGNYGIIGDFATALEKMERFDYGSDNISLLRLKYFIQEYQLNGSVNTIQQVADETYLFSNQLEKYISDKQVVLVIYALSDYEANFKRLVTIDSTLGLYSKGGLQAELFLKMDQIDIMLPLIETDDQISAAYSGIVRNTMVSLGIATLLIGFSISKFRERDLKNDKRILEAKVLERTSEIDRKNKEISAQAEEISTINQNLEALVEDRTAQLKRKNQALEEYAFINAHKLRAPLASILGLVNLMSAVKLNDDDKIILDHLQSSAEELDSIVHSITRAIEGGDDLPRATVL